MQPVTTQSAPSQTLPPELKHAVFNRNEDFAALFLGVNKETLRGWRKRGIGPVYKKPGGKLVRYSVTSLLVFMESQPGGGRAA